MSFQNIEEISNFNQLVLKSISDKSFAKLTFAKTIGKPELLNIFLRLTKNNEALQFEVTFKGYNEGLYENKEIHEFEILNKLLNDYLFNPFVTVILFTTNNDYTLKINKKRALSITETSPTFKNPDPIFSE